MSIAALLVLTQVVIQPSPPGDLAMLCQREGIVGLSVAVFESGRITTYQGGWADREAKKPMTEKTLLRYGSIAKPVTAVLVMDQVQKGKLNLHQGVSKWIPGYDDKGGKINLRRILSHTSGIRHYQTGKPDTFYTRFSVDQGLQLFAKDPLLFEPGEKYSYSTHAYTVAAVALEKVTGKKFDQLVKELGIEAKAPTLMCENRFSFNANRTKLYKKATPAPILESKEEDISWKAAGGGMESTAVDLAKFGAGVMTAALVNSASRHAMWTSQVLHSGRISAYGLGWQKRPNGFWGHGGSQQGCTTLLLVDPVRKKVVAVMANTEDAGAAVGRVASQILAN
jgi:CubicO group peptidase (beta-lactamase class C family)